MESPISADFHKKISSTDKMVEDFLKEVNDREMGFVTYFNDRIKKAIDEYDLKQVEVHLTDVINDYEKVPGGVVKPFRLLAKLEQIRNHLKKK